MDALKKLDDGIARGEAALATLFLLAMIVAASIQAIFRNIAGFDVAWANAALESLTWIDPFLQKGTLWLAFLGASLATKDERHIGVDLFPRLVPYKGKLVMRAITGIGSAVVSFFLARAFWAAVLVNAGERPANMEVYGDAGSMHVCDATLAQVTDAGLEMPSVFCGIRSAFSALSIPVETPAAALQLIVPVMFVVISARLLASGIGSILAMNKAEPPKGKTGSATKPEAEGDL
ncbi:MAG: TRAP transporter small permease [Sandaracinaceae bacterium]